MVFDGAKLQMKNRIESERQKQRSEAKAKAKELEANGDTKGATKKFIEAIEITPEIVSQLIAELKRLKVDYFVAPYEADAQLAYFYLQKQIDLVITEDSDLLLFGAAKVLFKMNRQGQGFEIDLQEL